MEEIKSNEIVEVYDQLIQAWNDRDAKENVRSVCK